MISSHHHSSFVFWFACRTVWSKKYRYFGAGSISVIITTLTVPELQKQPLIVHNLYRSGGVRDHESFKHILIGICFVSQYEGALFIWKNSSAGVPSSLIPHSPACADISVRRMHGKNAARRGEGSQVTIFTFTLHCQTGAIRSYLSLTKAATVTKQQTQNCKVGNEID